MVGVALRVVVLDQERGPVNPVVVTVPGFRRASPGEADLARVDLAMDARHPRVRAPGVHVAHVLPDHAEEHLALRVVHARRGEPLDGLEPGFPVVTRDDVAGRFSRDHRRLALLRVKAQHQGARHVLLAAEGPPPGLGPGWNPRRIGPHERGPGHGQLVARRREVERQVVALEAPPPGPVRAGRAEDRDVIVLGIAALGTAFQDAQNPFQFDDRVGLVVPLAAHRRLEEGMCGAPLLQRHVLEREAVARHGREGPVEALLVAEVVGGPPSGLVVEEGEEGCRGPHNAVLAGRGRRCPRPSGRRNPRCHRGQRREAESQAGPLPCRTCAFSAHFPTPLLPESSLPRPAPRREPSAGSRSTACRSLLPYIRGARAPA